MANQLLERVHSWWRPAKHYVEDRISELRSFTASPIPANPSSRARSRRPLASLYGLLVGRLVPFTRHHHFLMILCVVSIVLISIVFAGCSSTSVGLPETFIVDLKDNVNTTVRVGFLGLCITIGHDGWTCPNDVFELNERLSAAVKQTHVVDVAMTIKDKVLFPWLMFIGAVLTMIALGLLAAFPSWHDEKDPRTGSDVEVKQFPSKRLSFNAAALLLGASVLLFASALWQHVAAVGAAALVGNVSNIGLQASVGKLSTALIWAAFVIDLICFVGVYVMILSVLLLDSLRGDSRSSDYSSDRRSR